MARRKGVNNRGKVLSPKDHKRRKDQVEQRKLIIIACEGKKTEPQYFQAFFNMLKKERRIASGSCVIAPHGHTHPTGVLKDLINYKGRKGEGYLEFDERWIVIDRDAERTGGGGHSAEDYNSAILQSVAKGVSVAYSNPCFELWFLLHFNYYNTSIDRDSARKKLKQHMPGYSKSDKNHFDFLFDKMDKALENARKLDREATGSEVKNANRNPMTKVYKIVEKLQSYLTETHYLLSSNCNKNHLLSSLAGINKGKVVERGLIEE